jgi:hypothetical protein
MWNNRTKVGIFLKNKHKAAHILDVCHFAPTLSMFRNGNKHPQRGKTSLKQQPLYESKLKKIKKSSDFFCRERKTHYICTRKTGITVAHF